jgi:hypothetical protein
LVAQGKLIETRIEERDGTTWITGLCVFCWERFGFHAPPEGTTPLVACPNGHDLRIVERHSAGEVAVARGVEPRV